MERFKRLGLLDKITVVLYVIAIVVIPCFTVGLSVFVWLEPTTQILGVSPLVEFLIYWVLQLFIWIVVYTIFLHVLVAELAWELWRKII
tara:strand:+ start:1069 stop:1335 length:267 start_codon:yes stop_codon:yes gene_type:complete